jgi:hypothetical protein
MYEMKEKQYTQITKKALDNIIEERQKPIDAWNNACKELSVKASLEEKSCPKKTFLYAVYILSKLNNKVYDLDIEYNTDFETVHKKYIIKSFIKILKDEEITSSENNKKDVILAFKTIIKQIAVSISVKKLLEILNDLLNTIDN